MTDLVLTRLEAAREDARRRDEAAAAADAPDAQDRALEEADLIERRGIPDAGEPSDG